MPPAEAAVLDTTGFPRGGAATTWDGSLGQPKRDQGLGPLTMEAVKNPERSHSACPSDGGIVFRFTRVPFGPLSPIMQQRSISYHFDTIDMDWGVPGRRPRRRPQRQRPVLAAISVGMPLPRTHGAPVDELRMNARSRCGPPVKMRRTRSRSHVSRSRSQTPSTTFWNGCPDCAQLACGTGPETGGQSG